MRLSLRSKLLSIVGATAFAFLLVIGVSALVGLQEAERLIEIERRFLPKLELGPQLEGDFGALRRALQDAVAAQDKEALEETRAILLRIHQRLDAARAAIDPAQALAARAAVDDYHDTAAAISRRLIGGETGETVVEAMADMQAKQSRAEAALEAVAHIDRRELSASFAAAREARQTAATYRLAISFTALAVVLLLSLGFARGLLSVIADVKEGFARFGEGDFSRRIAVASGDEIGDLARAANQMADRLRRLDEMRTRADWIKTGQAGLGQELLGELDPRQVGERAIRYLASYVEAAAGALYAVEPEGTLVLSGTYAASGSAGPKPSFELGEGLVGQAARKEEMTIIFDPPEDYLRVRSGLGEGRPRALILVPLLHLGALRGVIELAFFKPVAEDVKELLLAVRATVAVAYEVANARATTRRLLEETQRQATQLAIKEEELRSNNEELTVQQEELRQANEELETQRGALQDQNVQLERARRELETKAEELVTVSAYKSRFLANMSHELRTPLNSMLILSSLLGENETGNLTEKQVEYARTIYSAGKDLLRLINQVLDLSKIEAGKQSLQIERVQLGDVADHLKRMFDPLARDKGLRFTVEVQPGLPKEIATDAQRLEQILTNLLGNAIKFTAQGEVALRICRPAREVRFARKDVDPAKCVGFVVSDTGIGIAKADQELVFRPFEQLEGRIDRRYGGTGLGLSISRELSHLLGGELHLESTVGKGSTFSVYLPVEGPRQGAAAADGSAQVPEGPPPARGMDGTRMAAKPRHIEDDRAKAASPDPYLLVIEDDALFAEQLAELIHSRGLRTLVAETGEEGVRLARQFKPQGIVLDVRLPDIDGWTVMDRLRASPETAAIPVHFVSAVDSPERGWAMGAVGYLTKPVSRKELNAVIQTLAPEAKERSKKILVVEDDVDRGTSVIDLLKAENLDAKHVTSARAALDALAGDRYGCIILDLGLPDMDGLELLELLKARKDVATPPVVVYTGRALTKDETRRVEAYADTVVLKEGRSVERLLEEAKIFVQYVKENLPEEMQPKLQWSPPQEVKLSGKKVLVVDDDMRTVYAMSALLRTKGIDVLMADNGRAALDALDGNPDVDAVLMDVMMPEMDGLEAMRRIRQQPRFQKLPVIALTAKALKGEREKCLEAGASDYLTKPVESERVLAMLNTWVGGGARA